MSAIFISDGNDVPASFGAMRTARKKSLVRVRQPLGPREVFEKSWGTQEAVAGIDLVLVSEADPEGYPIKCEVFEKTYEEAEPGSELFRKTGVSHLVQVPVGVTVELTTLEGQITVEHPDFIVVGVNNEVYANDQDWIEQNLEYID